MERKIGPPKCALFTGRGTTHRNFSPRQKYWLNTTQDLSVNGHQQTGEFSWYLQYRWSALNRHFQRLSVQLISIPMAQTGKLTFPDGFVLESKVPAPVSTSISWASDNRKRWILSADYRFSGNLGGDKYNNMFNTYLSWVISKSVRMRMGGSVGYINNSQRISNLTASPNAVEVYDWVLSKYNMSVLWTLSRKFAVEFIAGEDYGVREFNQRLFTFQSDGSLIETPPMILVRLAIIAGTRIMRLISIGI